MSQRAEQRIAIFLPSLAGGGAERVLVLIAKELAANGLNVDMVLGRAEGPFLSQMHPKIQVVDLRAKWMPSCLFALAAYFRHAKPDAMLSGLPIANILAILASRLARTDTRLVACLHCVESLAIRSDPRYIRRWLTCLLYPWIMRRNSTFVAVSRGVADDFVAFARVPRERVRVINNPVVTSDLSSKSLEPVNEVWAVQSDASPLILAVGRLNLVKDFTSLIRAFALVRRTRRARLVILGEGPERRNLEQTIRECGLETSVWLPGFVENPFRFMRRADLLVLSSRIESFGNVLVEAMACGTPVVSTDCPYGPREILEDGRWGQLVPVGDEPALADAILKALATKRLAHPYDRAYEFSLEHILPAYAEVLGVSLLSRKAVAGRSPAQS